MHINSNEGVVKITGVLQIAEAERLHELLIQLIAERPCLELDLSGVEACDMATLQLFCSLRISAAPLNKSARIIASSAAVAKATSALGISSDDLNCELAATGEVMHA